MTARIMQESYTDGIIFNNMNHVTGNPMSPVPVDSMHEGPENTYAMSHSASTSSLQPAPQPTPYNAHALTHDASQSSFLHPDTVELVYEREKGARNEHIKRNLKSQVREVQSKRDIDFRRLQSEIRTLHSKYLLEQNEREEKERLIQVCVKKEHTLMENIGRVKSELFLTGKKLQETQVRMREIIASSKKDFRLLSKQHSNTQQSLKESRMKRKELEQEVEQWHNKQHAHELHRSRLEHKLSEISAQHEQAKGSVKEVRSLAQNLSQKLELEKKEKGEVRQEAAEWKLKHKQLVVDKRKMHMEYETMMDQLRIDHLGCGTEILTHKKRAEVFENTIAELRKETEELVGLRELENKYNDLQQVHDKCPTASQLHAVSTKLRQFEFHDQKKKDLGVRAIDRIKNMAPQIGLGT